MLAVLSPAKTLDEETPVPRLAVTDPMFADEAATLAKAAAKLRPSALGKLMHISPALATLNAERFRSFGENPGRPAIRMFDGDVYAGLQGKTLDAAGIALAQEQIRILSGLYGLLRPLDVIQPYRLEMGTAMKIGRKHDLYSWWDDRIGRALADELKGHDDPTLINLASKEYFDAVVVDRLPGAVIAIDFRDEAPGGGLRFNTFAGKRARGAMARYIVDERIDRPEGMKAFTGLGYEYRDIGSDPDRWLFVRKAGKL